MAYPITLSVKLADYDATGVAQGSAAFQLSAPLFDTSTSKLVYPPKKEVIDLTEGIGTVTLPATKNDPDVGPTGLTYTVTIVVSPNVQKSWEIELDKDLGANQNLADIPPASHVVTTTYASVATVNSHIAASTEVHGIADTSNLATLDDLADVTPAWGNVSGTLSAQTDLATALSGKLVAADNLSDVASAATARANLNAQLDIGYTDAAHPSFGGLVNDGVTDNATALNAAIADAITNKRPVRIPPGVYAHGALAMDVPVPIIGAGTRAPGRDNTVGITILKAMTSGQTMLTIGTTPGVSDHGIDIRDVVFDGDDLAATAIDILDPYGTHARLDNIWIRNCTGTGINVGSDVHAFWMRWNAVEVWNCDIGAKLAGYIQASNFSNCVFSTHTTADVIVQGSTLLYNTNNALSFVNCSFQTTNTSEASASIGLKIVDCSTVYLAGCYFEQLGNAGDNQIWIDDTNNAVNVHLDSCYFNGGSTVADAIHLPATATKGITLTLNDCGFDNHVTTVVDNIGQANVVVSGRINGNDASLLLLDAQGAETLDSGDTAVTVTHGLVAKPHKITVQPLNDITPASYWWLSDIDSDSFTVNLDSAPTDNVAFAWSAETGQHSLLSPATNILTLWSGTFTGTDDTLLTAYTPETGDAMTVLTGTSPKLSSNALAPSAAENELAWVDIGETDMTVEATLTYHTGTAVQILARVADADNQVRFGMAGGGGLTWTKIVAGTSTGLWDEGVSVAPTYADGDSATFKIVCSGTTISVYLDGVLQQSATVTDLATNTGAGVRFNGGTTSRIDDFSVTSP